MGTANITILSASAHEGKIKTMWKTGKYRSPCTFVKFTGPEKLGPGTILLLDVSNDHDLHTLRLAHKANATTLAIAGAVFSLWFFDQTLNIFSQIGIIMLVGLVTKNGILIVEFANQLREQGYNKLDAAITAAKLRMRPILMTTLATVLGATPIAFALGAAGASRKSMGIVVMGGLLFSLVLTLYVIPAVYALLSREKDFKVKKEIEELENQAH